MASIDDFLGGGIMVYILILVLLPLALVVALFMMAHAQYRIADALRASGHVAPAAHPAAPDDVRPDPPQRPVQQKEPIPLKIQVLITVGAGALVLAVYFLVVIIDAMG